MVILSVNSVWGHLAHHLLTLFVFQICCIHGNSTFALSGRGNQADPHGLLQGTMPKLLILNTRSRVTELEIERRMNGKQDYADTCGPTAANATNQIKNIICAWQRQLNLMLEKLHIAPVR